MKIFSKIFFLILTLDACSFAQQEKVSSKAYAVMLHALLSHSVPEISVSELLNLNEKPLIIDAREPQEYAISHLNNAIFVGYNHLNLAPLKNIDKNQSIVVYCSVGYRSEKVTEKLIKMGFKNTKNLYGGIFEWKNQNNEVFNEKGKTEKIHAYDPTWGIWLKKGKKVYQ